jgi:hypothetical protein
VLIFFNNQKEDEKKNLTDFSRPFLLKGEISKSLNCVKMVGDEWMKSCVLRELIG